MSGGTGQGEAVRAASVRNDRIAVLIIDDHELLAKMLEKALTGFGFAATAVTGSTLSSAVAVAQQIEPDVCLLDFDLGSDADAASLVAPLTELGCRVIVLTGSRDAAGIGTMIEQGVMGILSKDEPPEAVVAAVESAAADDRNGFAAETDRCRRALREQRSQQRRALAPFERLTPREGEVLAELVRGKTAKTIAEASFVSLCTVRSQIRSILTKLGVANQLAAVAMANEAGWS
jgi:DNA-binding NarL/FixJ family response regulator